MGRRRVRRGHLTPIAPSPPMREPLTACRPPYRRDPD
jgi:hypothetical protein